MDNIWSENKYINLLINLLLFLVGINFFHYGQLLLPIICLILFIDNRLDFKVNSVKVFVILCLFGVSFYAFSYKLGFYSVMGFTLPMAYYIGSNIKAKDENSVKKVIYLLAISMALHVVLNSVYEIIVHGKHGFFFSSSHYDIWTRDKIVSTAIAVDIDLLLACFYYLLFHETNMKIKVRCFAILAEAMFYLIVIGRRTQLLILVIVMFVSFLYEALITKTINSKQRKQLLGISISVLIIFLLLLIMYSFNLFGFKAFVEELKLVQKLKRGLISDERIKVFFDSVKLLPLHLFGGQKISEILGIQIHHFWLDIYDYAGIVPFLLICLYSLHYLNTFIMILRDQKINNSFKTLIIGLFVCIFIQMNLEPMMTGASIFVIISVIIGTLNERIVHE